MEKLFSIYGECLLILKKANEKKGIIVNKTRFLRGLSMFLRSI